MRAVGLLIGDVPPTCELPEADCYISLSPSGIQYDRIVDLIDGESEYSLYSQTEQADQLAMQWARATCETIALAGWRTLREYRDLDVRPLIVNRLFRGFLLDRARIYLGVLRILKAENPEQMIIGATSQTDAQFAELACRQAGVETEFFDVFSTRQRNPRVPKATNVFLRDVALPAIRHPFSAPKMTPPGQPGPHLVFFEREMMAMQMLARAFDILEAEHDVALTVIRFQAKSSSQGRGEALYRDGSEYQNLGTLLRLLVRQAQVMSQPTTPVDWQNGVLSQVKPHIVRFLQHIALPTIVHTLEVVRRIIQVERPHLLVTGRRLSRTRTSDAHKP